jgi:hypothetical protein
MLLLAAPRVAHAEGPPRVAIYVQGTDAKTVRKEITQLVPAGVEVDQSAFGKSLEARGFVKNPKFDSSPKLGERVAKALAASNSTVAVVVRVNKQRVAHVLVFQKGETEPEVDETISLGKKSGSDAEKAALAAKLSGALPSAPAKEKKKPPEAESKAEAEAEEESEASAEPTTKKKSPEASEDAAPSDEAPEAAEAPSGDAPSPLTLGLSIGVGARKFGYKSRVTNNLRPYSVWGLALAELDLEAYPLAKSPGALRNLGLAGSFLYALPSSTEVENASSSSTKTAYLRFDLALRYRIPFAARSALFVSAGFTEQDFSFRRAGALAGSVPGVRYRSIEPALDAKFPAGPALLRVGASYRFVLGAGKLSDRFPHASVGAVAAHLGGSIPIAKALEARLLVRYERYFYKMNSETDDVYVAGGALDQYYTLLGGLGYAF